MRSSLHAGWDIAESLVDDILQDINQWQVMTLGPQYSQGHSKLLKVPVAQVYILQVASIGGMLLPPEKLDTSEVHIKDKYGRCLWAQQPLLAKFCQGSFLSYKKAPPPPSAPQKKRSTSYLTNLSKVQFWAQFYSCSDHITNHLGGPRISNFLEEHASRPHKATIYTASPRFSVPDHRLEGKHFTIELYMRMRS